MRDCLQSELREFRPTTSSDFDVSIKLSSTVFKNPDKTSEWPFFDKNGLTVSYPAMISLLMDSRLEEDFMKPLRYKYEQELQRSLLPSSVEILPPPLPFMETAPLPHASFRQNAPTAATDGRRSQASQPGNARLPTQGDVSSADYGVLPLRRFEGQQQQQTCNSIQDSLVEPAESADRTLALLNQTPPFVYPKSSGAEKRKASLTGLSESGDFCRISSSEESEAELEGSTGLPSREPSTRASPVRGERKKSRKRTNLALQLEAVEQMPQTPPHQTGKNYRGSLRDQIHLVPEVELPTEQNLGASTTGGTKKRALKKNP